MKTTVLYIVVAIALGSSVAMGDAKSWSRIWGSTADDGPGNAAVDSQGYVYVGSRTYGSFGGQTNLGQGDICLTKFDSYGSPQWTRIWGSAYDERAAAIVVDQNDCIYLVSCQVCNDRIQSF